MKNRIVVSLLLAAAAFAEFASAQQPPAPAANPQTPTAQTTADEVLLDVIVRDKKGKPITDLKPGDLTVLDDGSKQELTSVRLVQGAEAIALPTGARIPLDPLRQIRLVTLAFEPPVAGQSEIDSKTRSVTGSVDTDQLKLARAAATDLVKGEQGGNVFYSVVVINKRLLVLQPFTTDREAILGAIDRATAGLAAGKLVSESEAIKSELARSLGAAAGGSPADGTKALLMKVMLDMLRMDAAMAGVDARLSIAALQSLARGQFSMPGRKSILYFSSGMRVTPELNLPFENLIGLANRGNVTFYSIDTRGVMTGSLNRGAADQLAGAANASRETTGVGNQIGAPSNPSFVTEEQVKSSDNAETSARANTQLFIRDLAESTGGFLVGDSNDLRAPLRLVNEEIGSYYEVSYKPQIANYDGSFRKIKVDTNRKNLVVHARSGYFALPAELRASGMQVYEVALLKAISAGSISSDVVFRSAAVVLQPKQDATGVSVLVEVPLRGLQPKTDQAKKTQNVHFALGAIVRDAKGEMIEKVTRDRNLQVTADQLKLGNFVEKMTLAFAPGKYVLETAVMDRESGKIGMQRFEFTVAPKGKGVAISSLTGVRSYLPNAKNLDPNEPFRFQGGLITPTLNTSVQRTSDSNLRLFFTVYQDPAISSRATVEVEFLQNGKSLTKVPLPLPPADAQGRIPYVMTIPAAAIPPGDYEVRAAAQQGTTAAETRTAVRIE